MAETIDSSAQTQKGSEEARNRGRFRLVKIQGIQVTIDYSWFIIFVLVIWSLSAGYFPLYFPGYNARLYWFAGLVATLLFFSSILIHELSHSLTAIRLGMQIPEITLFIFGGVARLSQEATNSKTELKIAIAGPLSSFVLAGIFWGIKTAIHGEAPSLVVAVFDYLAWINVALAIFNLVPGFPLDGGRILRAIIWWQTGSVARATMWASDIGKGFAWALMILGGIQIFSGALIGGLWLLFIGMFLRSVAMGGYQQVMMRQSLEGVKVEEVMIANVVAVPLELPLDQLAHKFFLRYGYGGFPVIRDGKTMGLISLAQVKDVPDDQKNTTTVERVMTPMSDRLRIGPNESLVDALKKMTQTGTGRLLVMERDSMIGMVTKSGLLRFLEIKRVLER
ncbi:MAG: site-2 protease family protein [Desulfomonilaceae bacterium]